MRSGTAHACSCIYDPNLTDEQRLLEKFNREHNQLVFVGNVTAIEAYQPDSDVVSSADPIYVTFAVETVYKGAIAPEITLTTERSGASCGYHFAVDNTYLVFAGDDYQDGSWNSSLCSGNIENPTTEQLSPLGAGQPPTEAGERGEVVPFADAGSDQTVRSILTWIGAIVIVAGIGIVFVRSRKSALSLIALSSVMWLTVACSTTDNPEATSTQLLATVVEPTASATEPIVPTETLVPTEVSAQPLPADLLDVTWHLVAAGDEGSDMFLPDPPAWLRFSAETDPNSDTGFSFDGYSSCNSLFGNYTSKANTLVATVGRTEQGCEEIVMAFEDFVVAVLVNQPAYRVESEGAMRFLIIENPNDPMQRLILTDTEPAVETSPLEPLIEADHIVFDSWSPDGLWVALWLSDQEDLAAQLPYTSPGGVLTFLSVEDGKQCGVDAIHTAQAFAAQVVWEVDNSVVVAYDGTTYRGQPCAEFAITDDVVVPVAEERDGRFSADNRYHIETTQVGEENGILSLETAMFEGERAILTAAWQIDQRLGDYTDWLGGEWVSPTQFLIYETFYQGPLLLDAEQGISVILTELMGMGAIPTMITDEYALRALPIVGETTYHLLVSGVGLEGNFPAAMLYHAEDGTTESLPAQKLWWTPVVGDWIILNAPDFDTGFERNNLLRRRIDAVGSEWELIGTDVDATQFAGDNFVVIEGEENVVWRDWESGEVIGRYATTPFWITPTTFAPTGEYIGLIGTKPDFPISLFFLLPR